MRPNERSTTKSHSSENRTRNKHSLTLNSTSNKSSTLSRQRICVNLAQIRTRRIAVLGRHKSFKVDSRLVRRVERNKGDEFTDAEIAGRRSIAFQSDLTGRESFSCKKQAKTAF